MKLFRKENRLAPEIPELKKREGDEKKGGAGWLSGSTPGVSGIAVRGAGAGAVRGAGFLGSRAAAATLSRLFGGPGTLIGALFASKYGASMVMAAVLSWAGLVGAAVLSLSGRGGAPAGGPSMLSLGMGDARIKIRDPKDRALGLLAKANEGELNWENGQQKEAPKDAKADEAKTDSPNEPEAKADLPPPDVSNLLGNVPGGLGDGFTKRLSKDMGGGGMLAMGGPAKGLKGGAGGFNLKSSFGSVPRGQPGSKLSAFAKARAALASKKIAARSGRASRAMGQLKLARTMSRAGAAAAPDSQARQYAADAFDQKATEGGQMAGIDASGVVVPAGAGVAQTDNSVPEAPPVTNTSNATPYQPNIDAAQGMGNMAAMLKMISIILLVIGAVLVALGYSLMSPPTTAIGAIILGIGLALIAMGIMMLKAAGQMASAAKGMGDQIANQYGQKDQGAIVNDCADQAANNGTKTENCNPAVKPPVEGSKASVQQSVSDERNATYDLGKPDSGPNSSASQSPSGQKK